MALPGTGLTALSLNNVKISTVHTSTFEVFRLGAVEASAPPSLSVASRLSGALPDKSPSDGSCQDIGLAYLPFRPDRFW